MQILKPQFAFTPSETSLTMNSDGLVIHIDGPTARHNMPCAVCLKQHAVYQMWSGHFQPCWECQQDGYALVRKRRWFKRRAKEGT